MIRDVLRYIPASGAPGLVGLLVTIYLTRALTEAAYGDFAIGLAVANLTAALASQWIVQATTRFLPGADGLARPAYRRAATFGAAASASLALGTAMLLAGFFAAAGSPRWAQILGLGLGLGAGQTLLNGTLAVYQAEFRASAYSLYQALHYLLRLCLVIAFVYFLAKSGFAALVGAVIAAWGLGAVALARLDRPARGPVRAALPHGREMLAYGLPMSGWFVAATVLNVGDRYVIEWALGTASVGAYAANYALMSGVASVVALPVLLAAQPALMRAWAERRDVERRMRTITMVWMIVGSLAVLVTSIFARTLSDVLLGGSFDSGFIIMPVVLSGLVFWQVGMISHKPLEFLGETKLLFGLALMAAFANLLLNVLFVPLYGLMAAAYTTCFSYLMYFVITLELGRRRVPWPVPWWSIGAFSVVVLLAFFFGAKR